MLTPLYQVRVLKQCNKLTYPFPLFFLSLFPPFYLTHQHWVGHFLAFWSLTIFIACTSQFTSNYFQVFIIIIISGALLVSLAKSI